MPRIPTIFALTLMLLAWGAAIFLQVNGSPSLLQDQSIFRFSTRSGEGTDLADRFQLEKVVSVPNARQMALNKEGTVMFVGSRKANGFSSVYAVFLNLQPGIINGDTGVTQYSLDPVKVVVIASELAMPSGVAYDDDTDTLFVAVVDGILKYEKAIERLHANPDSELTGRNIFETPNGKVHSWKYLKVMKDKNGDKRIIFPIGSPCDSCETNLPFSTINSIDFDGKKYIQLARGIRNSVGFDPDPNNPEQLWFTENGNDERGNPPCDEFNLINGVFTSTSNDTSRDIPSYGFPYCDGENDPNPNFNDENDCAGYIPAQYCLGDHVAALGVTFYDTEKHDLMPKELVGTGKNVAFIAEHGSWNIEPKRGYRITTVDISDPAPGSYQPFLQGFEDMKDIEGRPVDVVVYPQDGGSLLISDDKQGAIYRVTYGYHYSDDGFDRPMSDAAPAGISTVVTFVCGAAVALLVFFVADRF